MKSASLLLVLGILLLLGVYAPLDASSTSQPAALPPDAPPRLLAATAPMASVPMANIIDYVMGNRSRMITIATVGLLIGLFILIKK